MSFGLITLKPTQNLWYHIQRQTMKLYSREWLNHNQTMSWRHFGGRIYITMYDATHIGTRNICKNIRTIPVLYTTRWHGVFYIGFGLKPNLYPKNRTSRSHKCSFITTMSELNNLSGEPNLRIFLLSVTLRIYQCIFLPSDIVYRTNMC